MTESPNYLPLANSNMAAKTKGKPEVVGNESPRRRKGVLCRSASQMIAVNPATQKGPELASQSWRKLEETSPVSDVWIPG